MKRCECCGQVLDIREKPKRGDARRYYFDIRDLRQPNLPIPFRDTMAAALNVGGAAETPDEIIREMRRFRIMAQISMEAMGQIVGSRSGTYNLWECQKSPAGPTLAKVMTAFNALGVVLVPVQTSEPDPLAYGVELKRNKQGLPYPQLRTSMEGWKKRKRHEAYKRERHQMEYDAALARKHPDEVIEKLVRDRRLDRQWLRMPLSRARGARPRSTAE